MGVDVTAIMAFGTEDESAGQKIMELLSPENEDGDPIKYYLTGDLDEEGIKDLPEDQQEIINDFLGYELWENHYSGDFEGFGVEVSPNDFTDEQKKEVQALFNKYNLGEPSWVSFSHWW